MPQGSQEVPAGFCALLPKQQVCNHDAASIVAQRLCLSLQLCSGGRCIRQCIFCQCDIDPQPVLKACVESQDQILISYAYILAALHSQSLAISDACSAWLSTAQYGSAGDHIRGYAAVICVLKQGFE